MKIELWILHMSSIILTSNLWCVYRKEWFGVVKKKQAYNNIWNFCDFTLCSFGRYKKFSLIKELPYRTGRFKKSIKIHLKIIYILYNDQKTNFNFYGFSCTNFYFLW